MREIKFRCYDNNDSYYFDPKKIDLVERVVWRLEQIGAVVLPFGVSLVKKTLMD